MLREIKFQEVDTFTSWEKSDRPYPWTRQHFMETMGSFTSKTLVLQATDKSAVGYATLQWVGQEAYIMNFMIDPRNRRKGWGGQLIKKVIEWARSHGAKELFLDVDPNNEAAVSLYKKVGFEVVQRRPHSYPRGEDAFVMKLLL